LARFLFKGKLREMNMSNLQEQRSKAEAFRALHRGPKILLLPNAWVAFSLGYADGQKISRGEMLQVVARIAQAVKVPVTADVEAGYGDRPEDAAQTAQEVIAAGIVGLNLEDARDDVEHPLVELPLQLERIAAVQQTARSAGVPLVLNARTDVYLKQVGPVERRYDAAVERLAAFRDAGADCVFAPGLQDAETIARLVRDLHCPLNILAGPGSPSVLQLEKMGVARVSLGSAVMRATLGLLQRMAEELRSDGTYSTLEGAPTFAEVNQMMGN
jgi:2-methylisocitrate lyase-like PEP mutase family enzyme